MKSEQTKQVTDVLAELACQGITLSIQGEALRCRAPKGALTEPLRAMLREHKAELLAFLRTQKEATANHASVARPKLERAPVEKHLAAPLSFAQQRLWFLDQLQPGNIAYNVAVAIRFVGNLQVSVLEQSLNEVVRRHESLRTTFAVVAGDPVQVISPVCSDASVLLIPLLIQNLKQVPAQEREHHVQQLAHQEALQPFDLTQGPLLRSTLFRLEEKDCVLLLTLHHIITDGWSLEVLVRELVLLYQAYAKGQPSPLLDLPIQYADYAHWQRTWLQGEVLQAQLSYWKTQLGGAPAVLELPLDYPRPAVQTFQGATHSIIIPLPLTEALRELSQREGATLFMTLLAAFNVLLSRYSRQEDIVVGTPVANRTHAETESLVGFFVNMLALRTDLSGNPSFRDLLRRVCDIAWAAYAHQDAPFEQVVEALQPERDLSHTPLFQVTLVLQKAPLQGIELGDVNLHPLVIESGITQFDLNLHLEESSAGIEGVFEYNVDLFEEATIARMARHWSTLLQRIVADPSQQIWKYSLLSEQEQRQLLIEWNATQTLYPHEATIHELFEAQVEQTPDAIAVVSADQSLTYRELNTRANRLAHYLHQRGVGPEVLVGLCIQRSLDMVVGLLGILKAGGAYVPLDPTYPSERLAFMLTDARVSVLITQQLFVAKLLEYNFSIICLDTDWSSIAQMDEENVMSKVKGENLVYVIYTSGSTGQPKGVAVSHQNLINLVTWHCQTFHLSPTDRTTQLAGIGFDASAWEIWPTLLAGACLHLPTEAIRMNPEKLRDWLVSEGVTLTFLPTPLAEQMLALIWPSPIPLRTVLTGGDRLHHTPPAGLPFTLVNNYGPTENTVVTTSGVVMPQTAECPAHPSLSPAIGSPIANTCIYLLDQYMQLAPIGVPGELYIGGAGLARGYLHRPDLTAERFVPNPFSSESGARLYRTGDLARYRNDGTIQFLGRLDLQVKIRGFRIELGEIEALLGQHPAIREVAILACEASPGDKRLVAYVVLYSEQPASEIPDLRRYLQTHLPDYMVPSDFVILEALPLTAHGKVDRKALPTPNQSRPTLEQAYVAPRDNWELQMARLWETILGKHPIGVRDDFFALGGHSFLAVALMAQVQTHFGRSLPLAALFQEATVEHLARLLRESATKKAGVSGGTASHVETWSPLVPIQPHGSRRPFFCVHGADGTVLGYRKLAQYLGPEQPFYGLQARGVDDTQVPFTDIARMAAFYLQTVRMLQPEGPYLLGGWSMGGLVAFEMAQQLFVQDQQVALVVLFDTWLNFNTRNTETTEPDQQLSLPDDIIFKTELIKKLTQGDVSQLPLLQLSEEQMEAIRKAIHLSPESSREQIYQLLRLYQVNGQASDTYVPASYSGRVLFFSCEEQLAVPLDSPLPKWATVVPTGLMVQQTSGDHYSMLSEPHVQLIAERLNWEIHAAQID